jgi:DNA-binding HxlR family transcriptional regulator
LDKLDRLYERKKFFKIVFPSIEDDEFYRIMQTTDKYTDAKFFNDIDEMNEYIENHKYINTYFNLSTTNGIGGTEEDIFTRSVLAFDFDKKLFDSLEAKDIMFKFKKLGLWYHILVDSGHGYHAYICIEPTVDINKVIEVTKAIGNKIGADPDAMKTTQVLRVPYTFNMKDEKAKQVNIINMFEKNTIKRYDLNKLYNRFCRNMKDTISNINSKNILDNNTTLRKCIKDILENGSKDGNKNLDLQKIVVSLRRMNKSLNEVLNLTKEWNEKSENKFDEYTLEYQTTYMYESINKCSYDCKGCSYTKDCYNVVESDFEYEESEEMINMEYKITRKLHNTKRLDNIDGNQLLLLNVLKHWDKPMNVQEIIKRITYKGKCRLSEKTIRSTLKELEEGEFVTIKNGIKNKGIADSYILNPIKAKINEIFTMSYFPTLICIYGIISPSELRLYTRMRFLHDKNIKINKSKGNVFRINQEELSKDLGTDKKNISTMIHNLIESKILEIWEIKQNECGYDYYTYRLVK